MGRGPTGLGATESVCRRVVLDANCAQGSPMAELEAVRARGFTLHLSMEGLRELWSRSIIKGTVESLARRVRSLATVLDQDNPVAFAGNALFSMIGDAPESVARAGQAFRDEILAAWPRIASGELSVELWKQIGNELKNELDGDEQQWRRHIAQAQQLGADLLKVNDRAGFELYTSDEVMMKLIRGLVDGNPVTTRPPLEARAALHLRYFARRLADARTRPPSTNDFFDARHLQHVAWPAFLMTTDFKLIEAADATRCGQAAWVRCPVEFVEARIFRCEPWGKGRNGAPAYERLEIGALKKQQENFRSRLRTLGTESLAKLD